MLDMSKPARSAPAMDFVDEIATMLVPWGLARAEGRVYGYLLLSDAPRTLEEIAADLGISKSGAFAAAQTLERFGNAQRHSEAGSKRIRWGAPSDFTAPFARRSALMASIAGLTRKAAGAVESEQVSARLSHVADFYTAMHEADAAVMQSFRQPPTLPPRP
jgi:hypothetical protein